MYGCNAIYIEVFHQREGPQKIPGYYNPACSEFPLTSESAGFPLTVKGNSYVKGNAADHDLRGNSDVEGGSGDKRPPYIRVPTYIRVLRLGSSLHCKEESCRL